MASVCASSVQECWRHEQPEAIAESSHCTQAGGGASRHMPKRQCAGQRMAAAREHLEGSAQPEKDARCAAHHEGNLTNFSGDEDMIRGGACQVMFKYLLPAEWKAHADCRSAVRYAGARVRPTTPRPSGRAATARSSARRPWSSSCSACSSSWRLSGASGGCGATSGACMHWPLAVLSLNP